MEKISLIIPTLNAEDEIDNLLEAINSQTVKPDEIIVVDSASTDNTVDHVLGHSGVRLIRIERSEFNHGLTRDMALKESIGDVVCFMTQDAVPADRHYVEKLVEPILTNQMVAVSSGRQLPKSDARLFERCVRQFNYGDTSNVRSKADVSTIGIKAYFATDVCSAYRRETYLKLGGFDETDMSEDMLMAAKAINAGYSVAYAADARVYHSHNLSPSQQFKRNYAIGWFLEKNKEIVACDSEIGEGGRLVKTVSARLIKSHELAEFVAFGVDCCARLLGNRAGRRAARKERK